MAIFTNGNYFSGAYLTGNFTSGYTGYNQFYFPLGMQEENLAIYSTSTTSNASKSGEYMFIQATADTVTAFNLKIQTYLDDTLQELLVVKNNTAKGIHRFSFSVSQAFNKIRIGANGSVRDTLAIFTMKGTLPESTRLGISVTVTNITQGSFQFGRVMIVENGDPINFLPSPTDGYENYLETEPFKIQGKYGPRICFVPNGIIQHNLIDVEVIPKSFSGTMSVYRYDNTSIVDINFTSPNQLTCASINQMVSKALLEDYGPTFAPRIFELLDKICWKNFSLTCDINCYYHNTKDIITAHKNGVLTEWKLTDKTVTLTNLGYGAALKNLFYLENITETTSLNLSTVFSKFEITGATVGDYVVIPNLKKYKLLLGEAATSRYQCLFGENSIDGILNYYTERGTYRLPYNVINNSDSSLSLYIGSGDVGIDYKIIPCGLNYNNSSGQTINCNQLSLSNSELQIYSLSNNYFKSKSGGIGFNNAYSAHGTSGASQQVVHVYLFDEDEFNSYTDKTKYNNVLYNNPIYQYLCHSFIPTAPDTLTESTVDTLSGATNGLLKEIRFGVKSQGDAGNVNGPYINFGNGTQITSPRGRGYHQPITVLYFNSYLSGKTLQSDCIQKENFTFTSCESIFFDGVPHPCNKDYYLTGNMVMLPAYNRKHFSKYFFLFIGARRITQAILNKTIGYYGPIDFTCDYFSYQGSSDTYWINYTPTFNFSDINETDFRIGDKIASIEDLNKKIFSYYAPSLIYSNLWSGTYGSTYNGFFKYFNAHMFDPNEELMYYLTNSTVSGGLGVESNLKVRGIQLYKIGSSETIGTVYENERDIKPMIYPCYSGATSTTVMNVSGVCISEPSNTNITYIYDLQSNYSLFLERWSEYTHNPSLLTGFTNLIVYNDGTIIDSVDLSANIGIYTAVWDYGSGNVGLYPSGGAGIGPIDIHVPGGTSYELYIFSDKYKNTFDSFIPDTVPSLGYGESDIDVSYRTYLPTISNAFNINANLNKGCVILIKFDFDKQLYYMDVSFSLKLVSSVYKIEDLSAFKTNFSARVAFNGALTPSIYPLSDDIELLNTVHLDDDTVTVSFRIYETNKVPFNVNGRNMTLYIQFYMSNADGYNFGYNAEFSVSSCLIHSDTSYQNWLFHYVPCIENKDIASGINASMATNANYWTLSGGSFSSNDTGLKLIYTTNSGSTYIYAATWPASSNNVNLYNSTAVDTGTCIVSSAVIISTHKLTGVYKNAIPFNFNTSVFPLVPMFNLMSTSNVVGQWYLFHYSQNINDGKYVYSRYDGSSTVIVGGTTYNRNVYDVALNNSGKAPIFVGFRPSGVTSNPYLLYGINIKYVDMSYLNDITHDNLYF